MNYPNITIKNMVCPRCITSVQAILDELKIHYVSIELGGIMLRANIDDEILKKLRLKLNFVGFEILSSIENITVEKVKSNLLRYINNKTTKKNENVSNYLEQKIGVNYSKITKLFSSIEGKTIERFLIELKIEKAKEFICYNELTISQIAYELDYSTPQHFSRQFKQITGMTASEFKVDGLRTELDKI